jgi:hypothetical protein
MNVQQLIDALNEIEEKDTEVVIFNDHQLNEIDCVDPLYTDSRCARVDLNMGKDVT